VADVCRQRGVSEASFYLWKKKYGKHGMTEIREMRQLRDENARLSGWSLISPSTSTSSRGEAARHVPLDLVVRGCRRPALIDRLDARARIPGAANFFAGSGLIEVEHHSYQGGGAGAAGTRRLPS
jgi:hypothetical protein